LVHASETLASLSAMITDLAFELEGSRRISVVTQLLENLAMREEISSDAVVLHDFARVLAIPLRDGCDLLDVIGRRLQAQVLAS
jgi:pilus assembly protein TadC